MLEPAFVVFGSGNVLWLEELEGVGVVEDREAKTGFVNLGGIKGCGEGYVGVVWAEDDFTAPRVEDLGMTIVGKFANLSDSVDSYYEGLVFDGTGSEEGVPDIDALFWPVGYVDYGIVVGEGLRVLGGWDVVGGGVGVATAPDGETEIVAHKKEEA